MIKIDLSEIQKLQYVISYVYIYEGVICKSFCIATDYKLRSYVFTVTSYFHTK